MEYKSKKGKKLENVNLSNASTEFPPSKFLVKLTRRITPEYALERIVELVNLQAEEEGLWSVPTHRLQSIAESHLQLELRKLHALIESLVAKIKEQK